MRLAGRQERENGKAIAAFAIMPSPDANTMATIGAVKKKMEELGFQNVRIEEAGDFTRGGWDNLKTYAAMTAPYYSNFACIPALHTISSNDV